MTDIINSNLSFGKLSETNKVPRQIIRNTSLKRDLCNKETKFVLETRNIIDDKDNFVQTKVVYIDGIQWEDFKKQMLELPNEYLENETLVYFYIIDNLVFKTDEQVMSIASIYTKIIEFILSKFINATSIDITVKTSVKQGRYLLYLIYSQLKSNKVQKVRSVLISILLDNFNQSKKKLFSNLGELKEVEISYDHYCPLPSFENMEILLEPFLHSLRDKNLTLFLRTNNWPMNENILERFVKCIIDKKIPFSVHGDLTSSLSYNNFHNILNHKEIYEKNYIKSISIELFDLGHEKLLHEALKLSTNIEEITIIVRAVYMYGLLKSVGSLNFDEYKNIIKDTFNFDYLKKYTNLKTLHFGFQHWEIGADFDENHELLHKLKRFIFECIISGMPPHISKLSLDNIPKNSEECIEVICKYLPNITKFFVSGDRNINDIDLTGMDSLQHFVMRGKYSVKLPKNMNIVVIYPSYYKQYESDEDLKKYSQYHDNEKYYSHLRDTFENELHNFDKDGKINYIVLFKNPDTLTGHLNLIDELPIWLPA
uniref:Amidohydro-rel domain-containing protein n=1 Tax=Strongyloides venezuelensis TaxID=75913 RepID=A0A0K0FN18_STRVS